MCCNLCCILFALIVGYKKKKYFTQKKTYSWLCLTSCVIVFGYHAHFVFTIVVDRDCRQYMACKKWRRVCVCVIKLLSYTWDNATTDIGDNSSPPEKRRNKKPFVIHSLLTIYYIFYLVSFSIVRCWLSKDKSRNKKLKMKCATSFLFLHTYWWAAALLSCNFVSPTFCVTYSQSLPNR